MLEPLLPSEFPADLSPQLRWLLTPPSIRRSMPVPYFWSPDLSNGFNPANGLPPVPCFNDVDDQRPPPIRWIADLVFPDCIPEEYAGCDCVGHDCRLCHRIPVEGQPTMVYTDDGLIDLRQLTECKPLIIECNPACKCNPLSCRNRVIAKRAKVELMVVRCRTKSGWGVRAMRFIPKGTFVCEYLGEVISDPLIAEIKGREFDKNMESYLFDLDAYGVNDIEMLTLDPSRIGNVSRYINHSCDPNLVQISVGTVASPYFHRIGLFAARNIYPNEELGFHYGYKFEHENPARFIRCNCGSRVCRTRLR
jgi:hypothetical protein